MFRLIAFGCSNTYGQGLPDRGEPPRHLGETPSQLAWPTLLAKKLDRLCDNQGAPGASNREIMWRVLNYGNYDLKDIVVIMWAPKERSTIITGKGPWDRIQLHLQEWPGQPDENRLWRKFRVKHYNLYDNQLETLHYIDYTHRILKDRVHTIMHYVSDDDLLDNREPYVQAKFLGNGKRFMLRYPLALDGSHPGEQGHREFANKIYSDFRKEHNER